MRAEQTRIGVEAASGRGADDDAHGLAAIGHGRLGGKRGNGCDHKREEQKELLPEADGGTRLER